MSKAVYPCICGELLYAERLVDKRITRVQHGENPEHRRDFDDRDLFHQTPLADWYDIIHQRMIDGLREETPDK